MNLVLQGRRQLLREGRRWVEPPPPPSLFSLFFLNNQSFFFFQNRPFLAFLASKTYIFILKNLKLKIAMSTNISRGEGGKAFSDVLPYSGIANKLIYRANALQYLGSRNKMQSNLLYLSPSNIQYKYTIYVAQFHVH